MLLGHLQVVMKTKQKLLSPLRAVERSSRKEQSRGTVESLWTICQADRLHTVLLHKRFPGRFEVTDLGDHNEEIAQFVL